MEDYKSGSFQEKRPQSMQETRAGRSRTGGDEQRDREIGVKYFFGFAAPTEPPSLPVLTSTPTDSGYAARTTDQYTPRDDDHLTTSSRL